MTSHGQVPEEQPPIFGARRDWTLGQRLRGADSYGLLLVLILLTMVVIPVVDRWPWGRMVAVLLAGATLLFGLRTSRADGRLQRVARVVVVLFLLGALATWAGDPSWAGAVLAGLSAVMALATLVAITVRMRTHLWVSGETILGAICVYLLIGMTFGLIYLFIGEASSAPFFVQQETAEALDYIYFSYITQATVGYGDLTASGDLARMLAVSEALIGQIYLVTVVALLVGNIGTRRRTPTS